MSFTVYVKETGEGREDRGESWRGETIEDSLKLCDCQTITPTLMKYLPKKGLILDAGCGLGRWVIYFSKKGYNIEGIELNPDAVNRIKEYDKNLSIATGNVLNMPYKNNSFDAVISLGVVEHFKNGPMEALQESYRILKPDGILLLAVPYLNIIRRIFYAPYHLLTTWIRRRQGITMKFGQYFYSIKEIEEFLKTSGLGIIETAADDFVYPKSLALYTDWTRYFGSKTAKWELNRLGRIVQGILSLFPKRVWANGILFVANKNKD